MIDRRQAILRTTIVLCAVLTLVAATRSIYITAKAELSQVLLNFAWNETLYSGDIVKPWPWADTWPIAKIEVPDLDQTLIVLEGSFGEAMAFGPAHLSESSASAGSGIFAVGGHRDTHLAFLQHIHEGTEILLQTIDETTQRYNVTDSFILDSREDGLSIDPDSHGLVLITCYPFHANQTGGPFRYVVTASPIEL